MSSLLALDPWHLGTFSSFLREDEQALMRDAVTSMPQYMLMAPVYINLLNIFAFSNCSSFPSPFFSPLIVIFAVHDFS